MLPSFSQKKHSTFIFCTENAGTQCRIAFSCLGMKREAGRLPAFGVSSLRNPSIPPQRNEYLPLLGGFCCPFAIYIDALHRRSLRIQCMPVLRRFVNLVSVEFPANCSHPCYFCCWHGMLDDTRQHHHHHRAPYRLSGPWGTIVHHQKRNTSHCTLVFRRNDPLHPAPCRVYVSRWCCQHHCVALQS